MTIFKMYDGRHVDLSKIIAVGELRIDCEDTPHFDVWFQLMDQPMRFVQASLTRQEEKSAQDAFRAAHRRAKAEYREHTDALRYAEAEEKAAIKAFTDVYEARFREGYADFMKAWSETVSA